MTGVGVFVRYPHGVHSPEQNYARTKCLIARLGEVSPLLSTISPRATRSGLRYMLAQPSFPYVTFQQWKKSYQAHHQASSRYGETPQLGVRINYWNRLRWPETQFVHIVYDVSDEDYKNEVYIPSLIEELASAEIAFSLMLACITSFNADRADIAWRSGGKDEMVFLYHRLWLKDGVPFPKGQEKVRPGVFIPKAKSDRYPLGHPSPPQQERWSDGTLYTWPEHAPEILVAREPPVED